MLAIKKPPLLQGFHFKLYYRDRGPLSGTMQQKGHSMIKQLGTTLVGALSLTMLVACNQTAVNETATEPSTGPRIGFITEPNKPQKTAETGNAAHTSRNSLDWSGTYRGVLPCADCPGIDIVISLWPDNRYSFQRRYKSKSTDIITTTGSVTWNADGNSISVADDGTTTQFKVAENQLIMLDQTGNQITGPLADHYKLTKVAEATLRETYWKLTELMGKPVAKTRNEAHMILKANEDDKSALTGRVNGSSGCNRMTGGYELKEPNRIHFTQMAGTMMACIDGMELEHEFLDVLGKVDSYVVTGTTLHLNRARMAPLAKFEAVYLY